MRRRPVSDSAGLRKPLHPFVKFVVIAAALLVALDLATAMLSYSKALSASARLGVGKEALRPVLIPFWISLAEQILQHVAYLIGLGVLIELVDRILWRLTPEAGRPGRRAS